MNHYLRPCRIFFSFRRRNGWHKPGMRIDTTCLFAKNARDSASPERNRSTQWKVLLLVTCESVMPIISKPQGALLLFSLSSLGFAPFSATHTHTLLLPSSDRTHSVAVRVTTSARTFVSRSGLGTDSGSYCFQLPRYINDFLLSHTKRRHLTPAGFVQSFYLL